MKILILSGDYPNENNPVPSIFVHNQVKALISRGIEVRILEFDMRSIRKKRKLGYSEYYYEGIKVYRIAIPCGPIPYLLIFLSKIAVRYGYKKVIQDFGKPDLIHAHFGIAGYCASNLKEIFNIPYVITEHGSGIIMNSEQKQMKKISKVAYDNADYIIAVGTTLKKAMANITKKEINIIPNILPYYYEYKGLIKNSIFTFVSVGRLCYGKRFDLTIKAFSMLKKECPDILLIIIGDGESGNELKKLVAEEKIDDSVNFLGQLPNKELVDIYNKSHCFVLPSEGETFGVVYAEAIACGIPIIATKCGGPGDIVTNDNGILVNVGSLQQVYHAMKTIYNNIELYNCRDMSTDALEKFGENVITLKLIQVYNTILK